MNSMKSITDYLGLETLQDVQRAYSEAAGGNIHICSPDGTRIDTPGRRPEQTSGQSRFEASVVVDKQQLARVVLLVDRTPEQLTEADRNWLIRFTEITATTITRLALSQKRLRARVDELVTLYRLTAEFTSQRDLKAVLAMVTKTVVDVMKAKACAIRLLSSDGQELRIMAADGLRPQYLKKGPIRVGDSKIDQEVLTKRAPVYVADARSDPRILYPKEMAREGIVSLLCVPLMYRGKPKGVLRVYTAEPYTFDWFEISLVMSIAAGAAGAIVNAQLHQEALSLAEVKRHLRLAAVVQRRMIPETPPKVEGLDIAARYMPCFELGGDFYDFALLPGDNLALSVCDVVGKGVRASLLMATVRAYLHAHAANIFAMSDVLAQVNHDLCDDTLISDFATLFYGVIEVPTGRLTYANAGHPPALLAREGICSHLATGGTVLGVDPDATFEHESITLKTGDVVLAYTDGLTEALNFSDEAFGMRRLEAALLEAIAAGYNAEAVVNHVLWRLHGFSGLQTLVDDISLVVIKRT